MTLVTSLPNGCKQMVFVRYADFHAASGNGYIMLDDEAAAHLLLISSLTIKNKFKFDCFGPMRAVESILHGTIKGILVGGGEARLEAVLYL